MENDKKKAGKLARPKITFGPHGRYAIAPVHTRFDAVQWFVWDAERPDEDGRASVIRQEDTEEKARMGLVAPYVDVQTESCDGQQDLRLSFQIRVF